ncbi:protein kinase domain-containing protein [Streptomyces lasalocidi]
MADVWLAYDLLLFRQVAVKTLRPQLAADAEHWARFRREVVSAALLGHPSVVAVYDAGEDTVDGHLVPYLVMEYVKGTTLLQLVREAPVVGPEYALELTAGVLEALDHAHRHDIVHRDVKPANVMLSHEGTVKVTDFGIARSVDRAGTTLTRTSVVVGTAEYLSPEQARGEQVDFRTDLYSTGCLLYELLTRSTPVHRRQPAGRGRAAPLGTTGASLRPRPGAARRLRHPGAAGTGQGPRGPVPDRRGDARNHRGGTGGPCHGGHLAAAGATCDGPAHPAVAAPGIPDGTPRAPTARPPYALGDGGAAGGRRVHLPDRRIGCPCWSPGRGALADRRDDERGPIERPGSRAHASSPSGTGSAPTPARPSAGCAIRHPRPAPGSHATPSCGSPCLPGHRRPRITGPSPPMVKSPPWDDNG